MNAIENPVSDDVSWPRLSRDDAAALDALVGAGWDAGGVAEPHRVRAGRITALLAPAERGAVKADQSLEDVTLLRAARLRSRVPAESGGAILSDRDELVLDGLVLRGFEAAPGDELSRRQLDLLSVLDAPLSPSQVPANLVERTLARIHAHETREADRFNIEAEAERSGRPRFQAADLISIGAILLLVSAAVWPMLTAAREQSRILACQTNMMAAGTAFSTYAGENRDSLPLASVSKAGNTWWEVGRTPERSNSANLFTLVRTGHARVGDLACHGNPCACDCETKAGKYDWTRLEDVSYSYQNMYADQRPRWTGDNRVIVMIDRSPVILRAVRGQLINPLENSPNHRGRGQNALFTDGSTMWLTTPVLVDGDNVWLPRRIEEIIARLSEPTKAAPLKGTEAPAAPNDAFLVP